MPTESFQFYAPRLGQPPAPPPAFREGSIPWRNGVLIRSPNWLGDILMVMPAAHKLKCMLPEPCGLFVLCRDSLAPVWQAAPWVDAVVGFEGKRASGDVGRRVRWLSAGAAVVFPNSFGAALDVFGKDIPIRIGRSGRGRGPLLTHRLPAWRRPNNRAQFHQLRHYLELVSTLGEVAWDASYEPLRVELQSDRGDLSVLNAEAPVLVMAPGAAYGPAKQWSPELFAEVAAWWSNRGGSVVAVGGPAESVLCERIVEGIPQCISLAGRTDLHELMAILSGADVVVANDSGPMHLAAALGCRGVALFGCTDETATGPIGGTWIVLRREMECSPCFARSCSITGSRCVGLKELSTVDVQSAILFALGKRRQS